MARAERIRELILAGWTTNAIAKRLAKGNKRREKVVRQQVYRIIAYDEQIAAAKALESTGMAIEEAPAVTAALIRRAKRGRPDAAKIILEMSGVHNPKVSHEHSGEIKISLHGGVPRPPAPSLGPGDDPGIVDAEVVDE